MRRKILTVIISALLASIAVSCGDSASDRLKARVKDFAATCPVSVTDGVVIETVDYDDNVVTYHARVTTPLLSIKVLQSQLPMAETIIKEAITNSTDPAVRDEVEACKEADATLRFMLYDKSDTICVDFKP